MSQNHKSEKPVQDPGPGDAWRLMDNPDEAVLFFKGNRLLWYNAPALSLFGEERLGADDALKQLGFQAGMDQGEIQSGEGQYSKYQAVLKKTDGSLFHAELGITRYREAGQDGLFVIIRNMETGTRTGNIQAENKGELERLRKEVHLQKEEIESQKDLIETQRDVAVRQRDEISLQQKEIKASIQYAGRIQSAMLPSGDLFAGYFPDHFIMYKPRDIVSGDFYWISEVDGKCIVAAGDCTGHGVPGALMSMIGITFLNEIVNVSGIVQVNLILDSMRERIIQSLDQKGKANEAHDGIDMAIIQVDRDKNSLQYAGAFNSLVLIRGKELQEIKGDRMPLGYFKSDHVPFTLNRVEIKPGDAVYLFSDGYIDQFGWRNNKKLKTSNFHKLLLDIQNVPMKAQGKVLESHHAIWKGELDQVDDILVLGLKI